MRSDSEKVGERQPDNMERLTGPLQQKFNRKGKI